MPTPERLAPERPLKLPTASALTPALSPALALGWPQLALTCVLCASFMAFNYAGLRPTDLWCHVAYGDWIRAHGQLPTEDPFMPLATGVRIVDGAWLSQVVLSYVHARFGAEALSTLFALVGTTTLIVLARVYFVRTGSVALTATGVLLTLLFAWSRLWTIRPEAGAWLCFALLLWLVASPWGATNTARGRAQRWLMAPLFMLWANLHGSFICGWIVVGSFLAGAAWEAMVRRRSWRAIVASPTVRHWLWCLELAVAGCLVNPYGLELVVHTLRFAGNPNMKDVLEWRPLTFAEAGGIEFCLSVLTLIVVFRHSRRPIAASEVVLLGIFAVSAVMSIRFMGWYAPIAVFVLVPHGADIAQRLAPRRLATQASSLELVPAGRSWRVTLACGLAIWGAFALSPASMPLLGGTPRLAAQLYKAETPLGLLEHFAHHPPQGQLWNPQYWGDWIVLKCPTQAEVFVTSMTHAVPHQVWQDYSRVFNASANWESLLERYGVETVVLDKRRQGPLFSVMRRSRFWEPRFDDDQAVIFVRRAGAVPSAAETEVHQP